MMYQMSECGYSCSRGLLITLNLLSFVTSVFIFAFAVVDTRILYQYGEKEAAGSYVGDMLVIGACCLLAAVAVFGCVGVIRNSVKQLYLYIGLLMILLLLELLVAIYVSLQRFGLEYRVMDHLREDFFRNTTGEETEKHKQYWEYLETNYQCCGLNGPEDYQAIHEPMSMACCARAYRARTAQAQQLLYRNCIKFGTYYREGCEDAILFALRESADCMLTIASMCFWFEVTGMALATIVANNLKNRVQVYKETTKY